MTSKIVLNVCTVYVCMYMLECVGGGVDKYCKFLQSSEYVNNHC